MSPPTQFVIQSTDSSSSTITSSDTAVLISCDFSSGSEILSVDFSLTFTGSTDDPTSSSPSSPSPTSSLLALLLLFPSSSSSPSLSSGEDSFPFSVLSFSLFLLPSPELGLESVPPSSSLGEAWESLRGVFSPDLSPELYLLGFSRSSTNWNTVKHFLSIQK